MAGPSIQAWASRAGLLELPARTPLGDGPLALRLGVAELFARYGIAHDEILPEPMADLFTADAQLDVSLAGPVVDSHSGRDAIIANFQRVAATQTDQRRHAVTNIEVTPTGDGRATARAYGVVTGADMAGVQIVVSCVYTADLRLGADGLWRFSRLWIGMDHYTGQPPHEQKIQDTQGDPNA